MNSTAVWTKNTITFSFQVFECLISFAYVLTLAPLQPYEWHIDLRSYLCVCFQQVESHSVGLTKLYNSDRVPPKLCGPWPTAPSLCGLLKASMLPASQTHKPSYPACTNTYIHAHIIVHAPTHTHTHKHTNKCILHSQIYTQMNTDTNTCMDACMETCLEIHTALTHSHIRT